MNKLTLENVSYAYKGAERKALDDISVEFQGGKIYAVIGPSGSGKTTLLSILAGLDIPPTEGEVFINNTKLSTLDLDQYRREQVSMIFQAFHLFPMLNVVENVSFPMELNGGVERAEARTRAKVFLNSVGITDENTDASPQTFRAVNSNGWPSRAPWRVARVSFSLMNRPGTSTRRTAEYR